jgi:hypothetical protein
VPGSSGEEFQAAKEIAMDVVYAAEKPSIAKVLSKHVKREIRPGDIQVEANPDETGSFFIRWRRDRYVMSPNGAVQANGPDFTG